MQTRSRLTSKEGLSTGKSTPPKDGAGTDTERAEAELASGAGEKTRVRVRSKTADRKAPASGASGGDESGDAATPATLQRRPSLQALQRSMSQDGPPASAGDEAGEAVFKAFEGGQDDAWSSNPLAV